ncbi:ABC transporter ATP-binding protein [Aureibacillus halotolerans]|uniref:ABC-2 type transport system ATP-binding protein n=1 Tax=Aureibacillus halotolerans TaxID=1508390 RepID=A0A4R6TSG5_9BACI|nr:ABC transporter ATP-binding protein [Aureibacillus halotolerans]TDQ36241.1 ABC-2 type transport system ATP-binding protein [Aureibacillus halotolerans]
MLEASNLTKRIKGKTIVDNLNLHINEGESVGLLGPNGAGKSTTISMLSTLSKPTSGSILLNGTNVLNHPRRLRQILGVVPQEIALYLELTPKENLRFFGRAYGLKGKRLDEKVNETLEMVGLYERKDERIQQFSGGMKRRVNIAAALLHEPKILIMDEPTVGIDAQSRNHILTTVQQLNQEHSMAILYTSHYMEEVAQLCSRVYVMDHGDIVASGTKDELLRMISGEEKWTLALDKKPTKLLEQMKALEGVQRAEYTDHGLLITSSRQASILSSVVQTLEQHEVQMISLHIEAPSLEDVFLHLTGRMLRD